MKIFGLLPIVHLQSHSICYINVFSEESDSEATSSEEEESSSGEEATPKPAAQRLPVPKQLAIQKKDSELLLDLMDCEYPSKINAFSIYCLFLRTLFTTDISC